jgi:hypothetical protein
VGQCYKGQELGENCVTRNILMCIVWMYIGKSKSEGNECPSTNDKESEMYTTAVLFFNMVSLQSHTLPCGPQPS